jgi:hypothetical protein
VVYFRGKIMKKYVLLGVIALVMLLAVPAAMAATTADPLIATGSITSTLAITNNQPAFDFGAFVLGINEKDSVGTLTVDAYWTAWTVTTSTSPANDGWMYDNNGGGPGYLTKALEQYNYGTSTWGNVKAFTFSGPKTTSANSTPMLESYRQEIVAGDVPGVYKTTVTYTVTAA